MKPEVLLDCDGVLCDFIEGFLKAIHQVTGRLHYHQDIKTWDIHDHIPMTKKERDAVWDLTHAEGWCLNLNPLPGAKEGVEALRQIADVHIVTSPTSGKYWMGERTMWLMKHFGFKRHEITQTAEKHRVSGHFLIDDKMETLKVWREKQKGNALLWDTPHNRQDQDNYVTRIENWDALLNTIKYVWGGP